MNVRVPLAIKTDDANHVPGLQGRAYLYLAGDASSDLVNGLPVYELFEARVKNQGYGYYVLAGQTDGRLFDLGIDGIKDPVIRRWRLPLGSTVPQTALDIPVFLTEAADVGACLTVDLEADDPLSGGYVAARLSDPTVSGRRWVIGVLTETGAQGDERYARVVGVLDGLPETYAPGTALFAGLDGYIAPVGGDNHPGNDDPAVPVGTGLGEGTILVRVERVQ